MLSDAKIRRAEPRGKPYKLTDAGGLYLLVSRAGTKSWCLKYRFQGREKKLTLGNYPSMGLAMARTEQTKAKAFLEKKVDPAIGRLLARQEEEQREADTFEVIAREWHGLYKRKWTPTHAQDVISSLEVHVFPELGAAAISTIRPREVLKVVRAIEERPAVETARRVRQRMSAVFVHAMSTGRAETDPAAVIKPALAPLVKTQQPAITTLEGVQQVLRDAEAKPGHAVTRLALRFIALTAIRPGVLRGTPWVEFDNLMEGDVWVVPKERMKMRREFLVPLSRQALETIAAVRTITGYGPLVFPNSRHAHRPMSENAIGYMLNRAGYHGRHVPHGWRSAFSTIMNERYRADRQIIDLMLAHGSDDAVEAAYNRSAYLDRRRELAQIWADLLLAGFRPPGDLLSLSRKTPNALSQLGRNYTICDTICDPVPAGHLQKGGEA